MSAGYAAGELPRREVCTSRHVLCRRLDNMQFVVGANGRENQHSIGEHAAKEDNMPVSLVCWK